MTPPPAPPRGRVSLVLPARDEAAAIGATLASLPVGTLRDSGFAVDVVVLDGRSRDATAAIARSWGATVLPDREHGKAAAIRQARPALRGDYVVMLDADGTYPADAIPRLLAPVAWGEADVAMGIRRPLAGAMRPLHVAGNWFLSGLAMALYARRCPDLCTGMWAFRGDALRSLPLRSRRFGLEAELFAVSCRLGLRIASVPVDYLPRHGEAKLRWGRDGLRIAVRLLSTRFVPLHPAAHPPPAPPTLARRDSP